MPKERSLSERMIQKAYDVIRSNTTTGGAGRAHKQISEHYNELDELNRQLDNVSPDDTPSIQKIFED